MDIKLTGAGYFATIIIVLQGSLRAQNGEPKEWVNVQEKCLGRASRGDDMSSDLKEGEELFS